MRNFLGSSIVCVAILAACVGDAPDIAGASDGSDSGADGAGPNADGGGTNDAADDAGGPPTPTGTLQFNAVAHSFNMLAGSVAFDGTGNVYVGGGYVADTVVDLGNGKSLPVAGTTSYNGFVAKYDARGQCLWALPIAGSSNGNRQVTSIAATNTGDVVFGLSSMSTTTTLGTINVTGAGSEDIVIGKIDAAGTPQWLKLFGRSGYETVETIAVDPVSGKIAVGGRYIRSDSADLVFDGHAANPPLKGNPGAYVALLDPNGLGVSAKGFPVATTDTVVTSFSTTHSVGFAPDGNLVVGGEHAGSIQLRHNDSGTTQVAVSKGESDGWLAKLDVATNKVLWATTFGGTGADAVQGVTTDSGGNVYATFDYRSTFTLGTTPLQPAGGADIGIVKFDPNGGMPAVSHYGTPESEMPSKMAVDRWGYPVVVGRMSSTIDFGRPATAYGAGDGFVARLLPTGGAVWAYGVGSSSGIDKINAVAVDAKGNVAVVGTLQGSGDPITLFGKTVNVPPKSNGVFLSVLAP
jgi:hypothetical protein